jgi:endoglucanase
VRHILLAEPLVDDFGACFVGADGVEIDALADSFRFDRCDQRRRRRDIMRAAAVAPAPAPREPTAL